MQTLITAPTTEPVSLADARRQCRIDGTEHDATLAALITAARQHIEAVTRRALITQTWELRLDEWPEDELELPHAPVQSITSIQYVDQNGALQTLSSSVYATELPAGDYAMPGEIRLAVNSTWPVILGDDGVVRIRYVAGYGAGAAVPKALTSALLLLVQAWFDQSRDSSIALGAAEALLWPFRILD